MLVVWWQENVVNRNKRWKSSGRLNKFFFIIFFRSFCLRCSHHHSFCLFVCLKTNGNSFNHSFILFFLIIKTEMMNEKVYWMLMMMIEIIFITLFLFLITWTLTFYDVFHHHWLFFSFFLYFISSIRFFVLYSHVWEKKNLIILPDVCCIYSVCVCVREQQQQLWNMPSGVYTMCRPSIGYLYYHFDHIRDSV